MAKYLYRFVDVPKDGDTIIQTWSPESSWPLGYEYEIDALAYDVSHAVMNSTGNKLIAIQRTRSRKNGQARGRVVSSIMLTQQLDRFVMAVCRFYVDNLQVPTGVKLGFGLIFDTREKFPSVHLLKQLERRVRETKEVFHDFNEQIDEVGIYLKFLLDLDEPRHQKAARAAILLKNVFQQILNEDFYSDIVRRSANAFFKKWVLSE